MNSRSPRPSSRKRGPRPPRAGRTAATTDSAPLPVPARVSSASCPSRSLTSLPSGISGLLPKLNQHVLGHGGKPVLVLPAPLGARRAVVERFGPRIRDRLPPRIDRVIDAERGNVLADRFGQLGRGEVDG